MAGSACGPPSRAGSDPELRRRGTVAERGDAMTSASPENPAGPGRIVVVGGGLAGLRTIEELRARGDAGAVTLGGAEKRPPYDRPPPSKRLMAGELAATPLRADP